MAGNWKLLIDVTDDEDDSHTFTLFATNHKKDEYRLIKVLLYTREYDEYLTEFTPLDS